MFDRTETCRARGIRAAARLIAPLIALGAMAAAPLDGQVVNTLRAGWQDDAVGWSGSVRSTVALAEGNVEYFALDAAAAVQYQTERHRIRLLGRAGRTTASGAEVSKNVLGHLRHNYRILGWLNTLVFLQAQYNPFRRIRSRILLGLGARLDLVNSESLDLSLGASYMRESEELTDDDLGAIGQNRASYFITAYGRLEPVQIDVTSFYQPLLRDLTDARAIVAVSFRIDLVGGLDYLLGFSFEHDSAPPEGVEETDLRLRTGLQLDF